MYDFFRGTVANLDAHGNLSLEVGGVGYRLRISEQTRRAIPLDGSSVVVHARLVVREDDLLLFGFADPAERAAFDLLLSVQGVGPAVALAVLSALSVDALRQALLARDVAALRKVKGVGPKSAERLVLELADKVERIPASLGTGDTKPRGGPVDEVHRALVSLGFSSKEAGDALAAIDAPAVGAEELLRQALGRLRSQ
jgi:Holliday junction DNA helicase RuvA